MRRLLARLERARSLDRVADRLRGLAAGTVGKGRLGDLLHGLPIGHPLHPAVVQFPVGAWMSTAVLDLLPGTRHAATALLAAGTAGALPAAMTGAADYATLPREQRRVALVHAAANTAALSLFTASVVARLRGRHGRGRALSFAGLGIAGASAYLGGHLAFGQGGGVNHSAAALHLLPRGWHRLGATDTIPDGQVSTRQLGDTPIVVYREQDRFTAFAGRCAHQGGPLTAGITVDVDGARCLRCPWHGSVFRLADGRAVRGPAGSDQALLRTRVRDGQLEAARP
ncbi:Rieske (2Fe-2S) protein [Dactylosporangium sp. NPDC049525]|uniref:Rieske (2Fe-2S) protein n=1 Tax=Dactylosporangium sp. NPDC049525 TaxID=3154730 RepID=UPI00342C022D